MRPGVMIAATFAGLVLFASHGSSRSALVTWVPAADGFWDVNTNWSSNPLLPTAGDDVTIDVSGLRTITHRSGTDTINSLSMPGDDILAITGGTLTVSNAYANNAATTTSAGTLVLNGVSSTASLTQTGGQIMGTGNLTVTGLATISFAGHSGAATTTVQGATTISGTGLRLDGGRIFRNEGTVTQSGNLDLNSRAVGSAEAGNGTAFNAVGGVWNSNPGASTNFIFVSSQGAGDTGAGATFTNAGTFNKQGAGTTTVRTNFDNDGSGSLNVQQGTLLFDSVGALSHSGVLSIANGATLDFASGAATTHTINTASTTIAGTLQIGGDNAVNFTAPHTLSGAGVPSPEK